MRRVCVLALACATLYGLLSPGVWLTHRRSPSLALSGCCLLPHVARPRSCALTPLHPSATAVAPTPRALPLEVIGDQDTDTRIELVANVAIPDNDELNWPINVAHTTGETVANVQVTLHHLWHESVEDLSISLRHEQVSVDLTQNTGGTARFGYPRQAPFPQRSTRELKTDPAFTDDAEGDGLEYSFGDCEWWRGGGLRVVLTSQTSHVRGPQCLQPTWRWGRKRTRARPPLAA